MEPHYLSLDTCTWIYIVNGTEPVSHLLFIKNEIEKGNIRLLISERVITEWNKHKNETVQKGTLKVFKETIESLKQLSKLIGDETDNLLWSFLVKDEHNEDYFKDLLDKFQKKKKQIEDAVKENIATVDYIFKHKNTILIAETNEIKLQASELALSKKAPFHNKNSFADAIILLSFISFVKKEKILGAKFISYNTDDFCIKENGRKTIHPDLAPLFVETSSEFFKIVGEVLNTIQENIVSEETIQKIKERQVDMYDNDYQCEECDGNRDGYGNLVTYWNEQEIINEYDRAHQNSKFQTALTGNCDWCNSLHIRCPKCDSVTALSDNRFGEKVECEGGCGMIYFIDTSEDHDYIGEYVIKILDHRVVECSKCGNDYVDDGGGLGICKKCDDNYGYN